MILKCSSTDPLVVKLVEQLNLEAAGKAQRPKPKPYFGDPMDFWAEIGLGNHHPEKCSVNEFGSVCEEEATSWTRGEWIRDIYFDLENLNEIEKVALKEVVAFHNGCWPDHVEFEGMMGRCDSHGYVDC